MRALHVVPRGPSPLLREPAVRGMGRLRGLRRVPRARPDADPRGPGRPRGRPHRAVRRGPARRRTGFAERRGGRLREWPGADRAPLGGGAGSGPVPLLRMFVREFRAFSISGPSPESMRRAHQLLMLRPQTARIVTGEVPLDATSEVFEALVEGTGGIKVLVAPQLSG